MIRRNSQLGQQNRGLTLVNVLIAVIVFLIMIIVLMRAVVTGIEASDKIRRTKGAEVIAENVMEELKASSLEEVEETFRSAEKSGTAAEAVWGGIVHSSEETVEDGIKTYSFYTTGNLVNDEMYDVAVHMTAGEYGTKKLSSTKSMTDASCGYFVEEEGMSLTAAEVFQRRNAEYVYEKTAQKKSAKQVDSSTIMAMMSRTITIAVKDGAVDVTYTYTIPEGYTEDDECTYEQTVRVFENIVSEKELQAVYLSYYPLYSKANSYLADKIVIDNSSCARQPLEVFIIQMDSENPMDNGVTASQVILDTAVGSNNIKVCTNINPNIVGNGMTVTTDLSNAEETVCLYDVKVEVFSHADAKPFAAANLLNTYTGSILNQAE